MAPTIQPFAPVVQETVLAAPTVQQVIQPFGSIVQDTVVSAAPAVEVIQPFVREAVAPVFQETIVAAPRAVEVIQPMAGGLDIEYISYGGQQLAFYADHHLRTLSFAQLREHAMLLYRILGHQTIGAAVPFSDAELFAWILDIQRLHLAPLRIAAPRAVGVVQPLVREVVAPVVRE